MIRFAALTLVLWLLSTSTPLFILVGGKPIRASSATAEWALTAVRLCWSQKAPRIAAAEQAAARTAYDQAEATYQRLANECANQ